MGEELKQVEQIVENNLLPYGGALVLGKKRVCAVIVIKKEVKRRRIANSLLQNCFPALPIRSRFNFFLWVHKGRRSEPKYLTQALKAIV